MVTGQSAPRLIAHVVHSFAVGGLENGVCNLINRLPSDRWRHAVVALTDVSAEFCRRIEQNNVIFEALHKGPGHSIAIYPRLYRLFRALRPSIVHTRNLAALEATLPAWAAGVKVRVHGEHGRDVLDLDGSSRRYRLVRRMFSPFATRYIALSRDLEGYLRDRIGIRADRILQIYNGVDTTRFHPAIDGREPIDGSPLRGAGLFVVGTVGRMQAVKDQTNLVRAFVRALEIEPAARERLRLVIVGDGPLREKALGLLHGANAGAQSWLPGERSDIPAVLRGIDCFVLPSLAEGISNTILEAMATALPVIATRVGGNAELVDDGTSGVLVPAADSDSLARAILRYAKAPELARRHGAAGRRRVEHLFSLDRMVERYSAFYESLLESGTRRQAVAQSS
ncbi:MAG: TIGR03088 family PEP-CTERM/XrtA system glycosyltransferase [Burkholderiales bacterium]|nr:TIGR03088 family PEP-CTERM/XrtA system glycosyltransferase [Burkholderiales bacterium]